MMIQIERLNGPEAGQTTTHGPDEQVTFGRAADNHLRLAGRHLSRHHGHIVHDGAQWLMITRGGNCLAVGRHRIPGGRTFALAAGQTVAIDGEPLFTIELIDANTAPAPHAAPAAEPGPAGEPTGDSRPCLPQHTTTPLAASADADEDAHAPSPARRSRLWIGIGVYLLIILGAFGVLSGLSSQRQAALEMPAQLADDRIAAEIREPLQRVPSEREAARHLADAQRWYARSESSPDGLFLAHYHYKLAHAYAGLQRAKPLDSGLDQLRYRELEQRLIRKMQRDYRQAFALAHNREWQAAERAIRALLLRYTPPPDQPSPLVANLEQQLRFVTRSRPGQSFR